MNPVEDLPRVWPTIWLPGINERTRSTYWMLELDAMPPVLGELDGSLAWLLATPTHQPSLQQGPDDPAERAADGAGLEAVVPGLRLPAAFERFIRDPEPRRHMRSATSCYLDLGHFATSFGDGRLIHVLSDQQGVLHWLLWAGADGSEAVVIAEAAVGFDLGDESVPRRLDASAPEVALAVCADTFEQFLYRYWAMNELFYRLAVEKITPEALPAELAAFADAYPRARSDMEFFT